MRKLITLLASLCCLVSVSAMEIDRVEPPFWWVGMKNPSLQLLIHGKDIGDAKVSLKQKGVKLGEIIRTGNPNYLFINLEISSKAKSGTFDIVFDKDGQRTVREYELKERSTTPGAQGFGPEDVLYLITPDRFANGDPSNDTIGGANPDRKRDGGRHGGDIKGVSDHMDYIKDLGMTTIWLNPVQENSARTYHGYAITDYYAVDHG